MIKSVYLYIINLIVMQDYEIKKRVMCWPSTIFGGITILYALFMFSGLIPSTMFTNMIMQILGCSCGVVFIFSKL